MISIYLQSLGHDTLQLYSLQSKIMHAAANCCLQLIKQDGIIPSEM